MKEFLKRVLALTNKEFKQLWRDKANIMLGIGLPIILIFVFGYGISFDIRNAKLGVIDLTHSELSVKLHHSINASHYLDAIAYPSIEAAKKDFLLERIEGVVVIPNNFDAALWHNKASIEVFVDGKDPNRAQALQGYVASVISQTYSKESIKKYGRVPGSIDIAYRMWFNQAVSSTWYIVPGLIVLIITLVGTFLTALVMAREWERGTLEAIFVSPVKPLEIILGKIIPYFVVGLLGLSICMLAAKFLFEIPIQGSIIFIYAFSMLYLVIALAIGLLISAAVRNQYVASQLSVATSFLPCVMLSGFIFDLRNVPVIVSFIGHLLPSTYFMDLLKTLYLAGNYWPIIIKDGLILGVYALLLIYLTVLKTKKSLD